MRSRAIDTLCAANDSSSPVANGTAAPHGTSEQLHQSACDGRRAAHRHSHEPCCSLGAVHAVAEIDVSGGVSAHPGGSVHHAALAPADLVHGGRWRRVEALSLRTHKGRRKAGIRESRLTHRCERAWPPARTACARAWAAAGGPAGAGCPANGPHLLHGAGRVYVDRVPAAARGEGSGAA
eukprot:6120996-Prymnesium_polylepis.1